MPKIKILPIFIVCAVLMLTVKVGNVVNGEFSGFSVVSNQAISQEKQEDLTTPKIIEVTNPDNDFSKAEVKILQDLATRRELLDAKAQKLEKRSFELDLAQEEIDKKIEQMKVYEKRLSDLVSKYNAEEKQRVANLIKVYVAMKPKDAAEIFNGLDMDILVLLLSEMKPSSSSAILSQMKPSIAKEVTIEIVGNGAVKK